MSEKYQTKNIKDKGRQEEREKIKRENRNNQRNQSEGNKKL